MDISPFSSVGHATSYIVSSESGRPRKLLPENQDSLLGITWSPDGRKIAGNSFSAGEKSIIRIIDLDSRQVTTLPGSKGLGWPRWSPDGRYLVADPYLKVFDFKTQQWLQLPQKGSVDSPEWSRDSQFIYFRRTRGDLGLFRIRVRGGAEEKIANLKDWHDAGWWGSYMGLDPIDAPLLLRDIGSDDIYALTLDQK
jgi:WD40 repeat protein